MLTTWCGSVVAPSWRRTALRLFANWKVSSHGRICDSRGVISTGYLHPTGYKIVGIFNQKWRVHRVVKITFHGLPKTERAWQVHHVDGDTANNRLDNLEYVTPTENMRYSFSDPSRRSNGPARSKPVLWRPIGSRSWTCCASTRVVAQQLGVHRYTVARYCREQAAAKGYEFRYQDAMCEHSLTGEEWRSMVNPMSCAEVPGRMVSSFGRITSRSGLVGQGSLTRQGYYKTTVRNTSLCQTVLVHRLVAFAFLGPPPSESQSFVNHKDLDKGNNAANNLEWASQAENVAHFNAVTQGSPWSKPIWSRPHGTNDDKWTWHHSITSAASEIGLQRQCISNCIRGLQRQTGGFEFQLSDTQADVAKAISASLSLPDEEWREINKPLLQRDKEACKRLLFR